MINCEYCGNVSISNQVCTECGEPLVDNPSCWNESDGQPDEAQEWHDFDPDCQDYPQQGGCARGRPLAPLWGGKSNCLYSEKLTDLGLFD